MDFDWTNMPQAIDETNVSRQEIEESFEDPFAVKLLPDSPRFSVQARYFNLGVSTSGKGIFSVYRTNGKVTRVIFARQFTPEERFFYQKKMNELLAE
ncbi:MAG: hypothetical protein ACPMAG_06165 [Limisphaerales bacterium]|jgi:uncharacterized DUF497 family protein